LFACFLKKKEKKKKKRRRRRRRGAQNKQTRRRKKQMSCSSSSILGFPTSSALSNVVAVAATWRVLLSADASGQQQKKGWCCGGGGGGGSRRTRARTRGVPAFNKKLGWEHGSCGRAGWRVMVVEERVGTRVMKEEGSVSPGLVHFVGIGGAGLSALAFLALEQVATEFTGSSSRVLISFCCNF